MEASTLKNLITLEPHIPIWDRVFTVAPLVVIGSNGEHGHDLAPKHMATPIGFGNYFGFVCTPRHCTYDNIKDTAAFTVSFPTPEQLVSISLSASPRNGDHSKFKAIIDALPTIRASGIDVLMIDGAYLYLECELHKIFDDFDDYSLITGKIRRVHVQKEYLKRTEIDENKQIRNHPLLAYIANGRFAKVTETFNFPFPKDFQR